MLAFQSHDCDYRSKLSMNNVFVVAERQSEGRTFLYCSCKLMDNTPFLVEIIAVSGAGSTSCGANVRSPVPGLIPIFVQSLTEILGNV